jgi:polysaccharide biosynthesis transport protein
MKFAKEQTMEARRLLDQAAADIAQSAAADLERARSDAAQLKTRLESSKKESAGSSVTSARLKELERGVEESRAAYQALLSQSRDRSVPPPSDGVGPVQVLSRAMPPAERSGVSPARVLLVSILLGLGLAISLAWLHELLDQRARTSSSEWR